MVRSERGISAGQVRRRTPLTGGTEAPATAAARASGRVAAEPSPTTATATRPSAETTLAEISTVRGPRRSIWRPSNGPARAKASV